jgi:hypothetical protein
MTPELVQKAREALDALKASADEAERIADAQSSLGWAAPLGYLGPVGALVGYGLGSVTDAPAAKARAVEIARQQRKLAGVMAAKLPKLRTDDELRRFILDIGVELNIDALKEAAQLHSPAGFRAAMKERPPWLPRLPRLPFGVPWKWILAGAGALVVAGVAWRVVR